jgi:predicted RNA-binding protein YlxR (DUF448 family)
MGRRTPSRTCVACRTTRPKADLVRIVRAPTGRVTLDPTGRAPGRGAYLCRDATCFEAAGRRHALEHALGVPLPPEVAEVLHLGPDVATSPDHHSHAAAMGGRAISRHPEGGAHGQE